MTMVEFKNYQNDQIFIDIEKIMATHKLQDEPPQTKLLMQTGQGSEDWIVNEPISVVLQKLKQHCWWFFKN